MFNLLQKSVTSVIMETIRRKYFASLKGSWKIYKTINILWKPKKFRNFATVNPVHL